MSSHPDAPPAAASSALYVTEGTRTGAWILAIVMLLANIAGYAFDLYQRFWWFDRILHAATLFALTFWAAIFLCSKVLTPSLDRWLIRLTIISGLGIAVGALWEVAEWGFDQVMPGNVIKGKHDTILDIIMDTLGALLAAGLSLRLIRP